MDDLEERRRQRRIRRQQQEEESSKEMEKLEKRREERKRRLNDSSPAAIRTRTRSNTTGDERPPPRELSSSALTSPPSRSASPPPSLSSCSESPPSAPLAPLPSSHPRSSSRSGSVSGRSEEEEKGKEGEKDSEEEVKREERRRKREEKRRQLEEEQQKWEEERKEREEKRAARRSPGTSRPSVKEAIHNSIDKFSSSPSSSSSSSAMDSPSGSVPKKKKNSKKTSIFGGLLKKKGTDSPRAGFTVGSPTMQKDFRRQSVDLGLLRGYGRRLPDDGTRVMKKVPKPEHTRLHENILFTERKKPSLKILKTHLCREGRLEHSAADHLIQIATSILSAEKNLLRLNGIEKIDGVETPLRVYGDIHGQFYDLLRIFERSGGEPPKGRALFLGDYVDRGMFGTECLFYLLALKINFPARIFMLRGNHESEIITTNFNFKTECVVKYSLDFYNRVCRLFKSLPIAAVVTTSDYGKFLCVHGGIGPSIKSLEDIEKIDRFQTSEMDEGPLSELLWSDPITPEEHRDLTREDLEQFEFKNNHVRGCGFYFGRVSASRFVDENNLSSIVRAHEVQQYGYTEHRFGDFKRDFPPTISLFSAPNYCGIYENYAGWMIFSPKKYEFDQCAWTDQPYVLPDFADGLSFSLPFIVEQTVSIVLEITRSLLQTNQPEEKDDEFDVQFQKKYLEAKKTVEEMEKKREERLSTLIPQIPKRFSDQHHLDDTGKELSAFEMARLFDSSNEGARAGGKKEFRRTKSSLF